MKSYTRKQMLEVKAKLKTARQEINRMRKHVLSSTDHYEERIDEYRRLIDICREKLKKANELLQISQKKKWYQFEAV